MKIQDYASQGLDHINSLIFGDGDELEELISELNKCLTHIVKLAEAGKWEDDEDSIV